MSVVVGSVSTSKAAAARSATVCAGTVGMLTGYAQGDEASDLTGEAAELREADGVTAFKGCCIRPAILPTTLTGKRWESDDLYPTDCCFPDPWRFLWWWVNILANPHNLERQWLGLLEQGDEAMAAG